jgi:hypothetical protein
MHLDRVDWDALRADVDRRGFGVTATPVLDADECDAIARTFEDDAMFRSTIDMARYRFGEGCYRYYASPLPPLVEQLRGGAYPEPAPLANAWAAKLGEPEIPASHTELLEQCAAHGQHRPTPLILRYTAGGWNALHQDLYGDIVFPLQLAIALSRPGVDFDGGEMLYVEQRPRAQSRGHAVMPAQGHGVVFATRARPEMGTRGPYRVAMRHGVSTVTRGDRRTLGIIFHDAE